MRRNESIKTYNRPAPVEGLPESPELEKAVLGALILEQDQLPDVAEIVEISAPQSANNGQIHPTKDKKSRNNSRLSSFRRYSVACIITRSVPRHSFTATVILPMDWMILAASGSRTTEIGCVAAVIALPLVVTS